MKSVRKWIRDLFGFSASEINGFLILVPLMLSLAISEPLYRWWVTSEERLYTEDEAKLDSVITAWGSYKPGIEAKPAFPFDPNTIGQDEMLALGISKASAKHIAAYRRKGGVFRMKSDLLKINGVDSTLYKQLYDHIQLPETRISTPFRPWPKASSESIRERRKEIRDFNINTADTLLLKTIYGIGPRLATRIIKFRDALGGFVKEEQLYEVYGLDSTVVERLLNVSFISEDFVPEKIDINRADEPQLSSHPYIRRRLAQRILRYRFQHGDFMDVNDIKKLWSIENEEVERLLPYIKI